MLTNFQLPRSLSLAQRERFTQALCAAQPLLENCDPNQGTVIRKIESLIRRPVDMISTGPKTKNEQILNEIPV